MMDHLHAAWSAVPWRPVLILLLTVCTIVLAGAALAGLFADDPAAASVSGGIQSTAPIEGNAKLFDG